MTLSGALSNALSGLTAATKSAAVVSSNIANSMTEGYGVRSAELGSRAGTSGGVSVVGITRDMNPILLSEWRNASSDMSYQDTVTTYYERIEGMLGTPEDSFSIAGRVTAFENTLISAAARPDLPERMSQLLNAAEGVADTFNSASGTVQTIRMEADKEIGATVNRFNELLTHVAELNAAVSTAKARGVDANALIDQRQAAINELSEIVPVTEVPRDMGQVALVSNGGAILLDLTPYELEFSAAGIVTPYMSIGNGQLSGLSMNGMTLKTDAGYGPIAGGRLSALFQIRDELTVDAQARIDSAAADMIERFQDAGLDATRAPGAPGLFTDEGLAYSAVDEVGISGRISVNALVDPDRGGATWRFRDGLGAATTGSVGDSALLQDMMGALSARRTPSSTELGTSAITAAELASSILSLAGTERTMSENRLSYAATRETEFKSALLSEGVDTDNEMQRLLMIEQAYAANARLISAVEEMLDTLTRI